MEIWTSCKTNHPVERLAYWAEIRNFELMQMLFNSLGDNLSWYDSQILSLEGNCSKFNFFVWNITTNNNLVSLSVWTQFRVHPFRKKFSKLLVTGHKCNRTQPRCTHTAFKLCNTEQNQFIISMQITKGKKKVFWHQTRLGISSHCLRNNIITS